VVAEQSKLKPSRLFYLGSTPTAHRRRIRDVEHLEEVMQTCWQQIRQDIIDCAKGQFRKRLSLVVATSGEHTEHRFD